MKILKFGGTSLANATKFLTVANIIEKNFKKEQVAVVLSAPENVTNSMIKIIEKIIEERDVSQNIHSVKSIFLDLIFDIYKATKNFSYKTIKKIIDEKFENLTSIFNGIRFLNQCPDNVRAKIVCCGELLSITIMDGILKSMSYNVTIIDPIENLVAQGDYLDSTIDIQTSKKKIRSINIPKNHIILMAGFIAGNKKKKLVVLGRNGSDYSAAILSVCLKGNVCEIWTDVDGIYTCDPKKVKNAKLLKSLSYKEAMEFSYFGAQVLHPKTIFPIKKFKIPCLIKNTTNPNAVGTMICENSQNVEILAKGIAYLNNITMFHVSGPGMNSMVAVASRVLSSMSLKKIRITLITQSSSEFNISFCTSQEYVKKIKNTLENEFQLEIKNKLLMPIKIIENLSILSVIGTRIGFQKNVFYKIFLALNNANIDIFSISQGSSKHSISIVVKENLIIPAINVVHNFLFNKNQIVEIFLIGVGGVGKTLLKQLNSQQYWLKTKNIDLKVCGIANSKKIFQDMNGIDLKNWKYNVLKSNELFNIKNLTCLPKKNALINPIIVDCTSDQEIANQYPKLLDHGYNIVTSNKKANTSSLKYYQEIRHSASRANKKFLYETNVGAGLPVIENLKNLLYSGDKIIHFRGILSGSLSFIFGKLEENVLLSEATKQAQKLGLTEPNPKDDLSGVDVARKLLILAREIGLKLELKDIEIKPILPENFNHITHAEDFMIKLRELDEIFDDKIKKAKKIGKTLRLVGIIKKEGQCQVKIDEIDEQDPLYAIKNGENALAFYSKYYQPIPLVLRGYGAGNDVTASGVFSDILRILS
ncbi:MAG: bifunctional aspartate kinase/homoserine dehydrogenase I [Buchnera aphidicola (Schlechtendalia chinensis)]